MSVDPQRLHWLRIAFMLITMGYFVSCLSDAARWFGPEGWISTTRLGTFIEAAEVESQAKWYLSPLWWTESIGVFYATIIAGMVAAGVAAVHRAAAPVTWVVWLIVVAVTNRYMMLAGVAESLLSLSLAALAIASTTRSDSWWTGFGVKLMSAQFTVIAVAMTASMWTEATWRSGLGAIALAEPSSLRAINWTEGLLTNTIVHELTSMFLIAALPIGLWLAWGKRRRKTGVAIMLAWSVLVAAIGSHFLHAALFAANASAFLCWKSDAAEEHLG